MGRYDSLKRVVEVPAQELPDLIVRYGSPPMGKAEDCDLGSTGYWRTRIEAGARRRKHQSVREIGSPQCRAATIARNIVSKRKEDLGLPTRRDKHAAVQGRVAVQLKPKPVRPRRDLHIARRPD